MGRRLAAAGVRTITVDSLGRDVALLNDLRAYKELARIIKSERPDILHLNSSKAGAIGALAGRLAGVSRIIFTAHGWALNEARPWWQKMPIAAIYYIVALLSHRIIAVSKAVRRDMRWMSFVQYKVVLIYNGLSAPTLLSQQESRERLLPNKNGLWIGTVAELHPTKRIGDGIRVFAQVEKKFPTAIYVILGEGEERPVLEKLIADLNLKEKVFLLGHVEQASKYILALDVCMLLSRTEGLAYAILEAGQAGIPVIATRVGGLSEIIDSEKSGLLVEVGDTDAVRKSLETLLADGSLRKKFGAALKEKVEKEFSLERMVEQTKKLYA